MSKEVVIIMVVAATGMVAMLTATVRSVFGRRDRRPSSSDARLDQIAQQLAALQDAVDTTSIEVERLGEGLRFTTKLLAERNRLPDKPRQPERVVTPH